MLLNQALRQVMSSLNHLMNQSIVSYPSCYRLFARALDPGSAGEQVLALLLRLITVLCPSLD